MNIDLEAWQIEEISKCAESPEYFAETYGWIQQKASAGVSEKTSIIPFMMGDTPPTQAQIDARQVPEESQFYFQRQILQWLHDRENVLTLKSRRVGCSWVAAMYVAWLINFNENVSVAFISETGLKAKDILKKVEFILKNLALHDSDNLKRATKVPWLLGKIQTCNQEMIEIAWHNEDGVVVNTSSVVSLTNTDDSARSGDYTFIVFDELDFYLHPDVTWASATTATSVRGGNWMAISTPNQIGFVFHRMCAAGDLALEGKYEGTLDYKYIRIHWSEAGITPAQIRKSTVGFTQELIDKEWEWKWIVPGSVAFDPTHLAVCYKPPDQFPEIASELEAYRREVFNPYRKEKLYYYSGADTAKANPSKKSREKDFHNFTAMTKSGIQAFSYSSQEPLSQWAGYPVGNAMIPGTCSKLHVDWPGYLQIEEEGPGYTTANNHITPEDHVSRINRTSMKHKFKKGIIERLILKVEQHQIVITSLRTYQAMSVFQKGNAPGVYEAPPGYNDDEVIGIALAEDARDQEGGMEFSFGASAADPQRAMEDYGMPLEKLAAGPQVAFAIPEANQRMDYGQFGDLPNIEYDSGALKRLLPQLPHEEESWRP